MSARMPSFFARQGLQLLLFGGKGGVGKTTCATSAALRMSALAPNRSMLLVSTDPAHSVRDSLAGHVPVGNLQVLELDGQLTRGDRYHTHSVRERMRSYLWRSV